jgi:hypothetical protein
MKIARIEPLISNTRMSNGVRINVGADQSGFFGREEAALNDAPFGSGCD